MIGTDYRTQWQTYAYPEENVMSGNDDIAAEFSSIDLSAERFEHGGIPLYVDGNIAYLNAENENTIIFGETGSKKTRSVICPLIATTAGARESAFITDVKGELSSNKKLQNYLKKCGINTVYLDFRTFSGDGYNILEKPFRSYKNGEKDKAENFTMRLVNSLNKRYENANADPFWALSSKQYLTPLIQLLFAYGTACEENAEAVNMLSVNAFANTCGSQALNYTIDSKYLKTMLSDNSLLMLKGVIENPDPTLACIMGTVQSMIQDFTIQKDLMYMLSDSTFEAADMYEKPTFVFLIVPDETNVYDTISGMLLDIFYNELIEVYSEKYQGRSESPCRINYICDEFCNLKINDMRSKISASRSRNMRWFLVCQSKKQLDGVYSSDAGTIIGNCKNILFLQSSDIDLLDHMSNICGKSDMTDTNEYKPLVSREMLKSLKKERSYKEALFIRDNIKYFALLPDIDAYDFLKTGTDTDSDNDGFSKRFASELKIFTPELLILQAQKFEQRQMNENNDTDEDETEYIMDEEDYYNNFCDYDFDHDYDYDEDDEMYDDDPVSESIHSFYYTGPNCGLLTEEEVSQTDNSDVLPDAANEVINRKLKALFCAAD